MLNNIQISAKYWDKKKVLLPGCHMQRGDEKKIAVQSGVSNRFCSYHSQVSHPTLPPLYEHLLEQTGLENYATLNNSLVAKEQ
jgi:hypothetical protein